MAEIYNQVLQPGEHDKFSFELGNGMKIRGFQCSDGLELSLNDDSDARPLSRSLIGGLIVKGSPNRNMFYMSMKTRNGQLSGVLRNTTGRAKQAGLYIFYEPI